MANHAPFKTSQKSPGLHIEVNDEGVTQSLSNLDAQKAGGPDNIPTRFLKKFSSELASCLTILFQGSLEQGIIPESFCGTCF